MVRRVINIKKPANEGTLSYSEERELSYQRALRREKSFEVNLDARAFKVEMEAEEEDG